MSRRDGRSPADLRPLAITLDPVGFAEGSALIEMGGTRVLCAASVEDGVPSWLRGKGQGWVTGEYSLLPRSTTTRTRRERNGPGGRTQEIQRLIGRSLRVAVDMHLLGDRTITVDCDVLQADGGTRTAAITGGYVALALALHRLVARGALQHSPLV
jgi:ribonuclease PH